MSPNIQWHKINISHIKMENWGHSKETSAHHTSNPEASCTERDSRWHHLVPTGLEWQPDFQVCPYLWGFSLWLPLFLRRHFMVLAAPISWGLRCSLGFTIKTSYQTWLDFSNSAPCCELPPLPQNSCIFSHLKTTHTIKPVPAASCRYRPAPPTTGTLASLCLAGWTWENTSPKIFKQETLPWH